MGPTAKRLDADDGLSTAIENGLVEHMQTVILDRVAQLVLQKLALDEGCIHCGIVNAGAVTTLVLGTIKREVGMAYHVSSGAGLLIDDHNADARADHDRLIGNRIRRADR